MVLSSFWLLWQPLADALHGVLASSKPRSFGPIENGSDALSYPPSRFRLHEPDWRKHFEHVGRLDLVHSACADAGKGIFVKGADPLCSVLRAPPCRDMFRVRGTRCLSESWHSSRAFSATGSPPLLAILRRVNALSRASARDTSWAPPRPMSRRRP